MSWFSCLSDPFKKRAGRYIINRYLGSFLEEGVLLDQVSVESGQVSLESVSLNVKTINAVLSGCPVELVDGYIGHLSVSIPWSSLLSDHCELRLEGLTLSLQVRSNPGTISSVFHSMYESFSGLNLAHDVSKEEELEVPAGGVKYLAEAIDSIITRIKISLTNTTIRLEYVPGVEPRGLALEIRFREITYSGERNEASKENDLVSPTLKRLFFRNLQFYTDEFVFRSVTGAHHFGEEEEVAQQEEEAHLPPPLCFASLSGRQELILRFSEEINEYGLPSVIEDVEIHCGILAFHGFPHQIHTVTEIVKSLSSYPEEHVSIRQPPHHDIESLLQKSIIMQSAVPTQPSLGNWVGGPMTESSEFHPLTRGIPALKEPSVEESTGSVFPKISIKIASFICALIERDEGISKLGGEINKIVALDKMRSMADEFFSGDFNIPTLERDRLLKLHERLSSSCVYSSHIQIVGAPVTITLINPSEISFTIGSLSVREVLIPEKKIQETYPILDFSSSAEKKYPDFKLIVRNKSETPQMPQNDIALRLNPVKFNLDLGIVDRTYLLLNYAEMDPLCLKTTYKSASSSVLNFSVESYQLQLNFYVPKIDLRCPTDIPSFAEYFWKRHVHSESLRFDFHAIKVSIGLSPDTLNFDLVSDLVNAYYLEDNVSHDVIEIRKLPSKLSSSPAAIVKIKANLDENKKLFWKFDKSTIYDNSEEYVISGAENGTSVRQSLHENFTKQIEEALEFGKTNNNLLIDLVFDDISVILPSKHIYEVIYNRLGNDLLLWFPLIYRVKEHIYGVKFEDPLKKDSDVGFSTSYSNRRAENADEYHKRYLRSDHTTNTTKKSFPKSMKSVRIHVDTAVALQIGRGQALICPSLWFDEDSNKALLGTVEDLSLISVVGLERDPEITLLSMYTHDGAIKLGIMSDNLQKHFLQSSDIKTLFQRTDFSSRAWHDLLPESPCLLRLTSKILFDNQNNMKSINLCFTLQEASLRIISDLIDNTLLDDWIVDFFTVVEYPIVGYEPPVILTEMQFDIKRSSVDLFFPSDHRLTACLGSVKVSCNMIDSSSDMSIALCLEDVGVYLSCNTTDFVSNSVCFCDLDYFDLNVFFKENFDRPPVLNVSCNCSLLRIRTCSDTIIILTKLFSDFYAELDRSETKKDSSNDDISLSQNSLTENEAEHGEDSVEDVTPDLAEAMEELLRSSHNEVQDKKDRRSSKSKGAQVFYFPDEANQIQFPDTLGMTQSFYADPNAMTASDIRESYENNEDSFDEEFCILDDEIGTGIVSKNGEPTVRCLLDDEDHIVLIDNHFSIPEQSIDYLKTPKNFPKYQTSFTLKKLSILWKIYGGNDFNPSKELGLNTKSTLQKMGMSLYVDPHTSEVISQEENIVGQKRKMKEKSPPCKSARLLADMLKTKGGPGRNEEQLLEIHVHKLQLKHEMYDGEVRVSSRQVLIIPLFEIRDRLAISDINKLLYPYASRTRPQRTNANMFSYKCVNVRKEGNMTESNIIVSLQPFRINIDQDSLFFIVDFCGTLFPDDSRERKIHPTTFIPEEATMNASDSTVLINEEEERHVGPNLPKSKSNEHKRKQQPYIRSFVFSHSVPIRIDYLGKYVDLTQGALKGLLVGLAQLNCSELTLKKVSYTNGILGLEKLFKMLVCDWMEDVKQNQVSALLGGVGPVYSFVQLAQGVKDLIMLPLEQYQKDGRFIRGLQKGANSFTASTAMSLLDITNKMLGLIKFAAEMAFDIMSPEGMILHGKNPQMEHKIGRRLKSTVSRPSDMREGVFNAITVVREGFDETARTLIDAASNDHSRKGITGAVGGVLKQVPSTIVKPVIVAVSATSNVLEGVKNQVAPEVRKEEEEKWRKSFH